MRFWDRATIEQVGIARHRQVRPRIRHTSQGNTKKFGQRRMFSDCLDDESYETEDTSQVPLGREIDVAETHPLDRSAGSVEDELRKAEDVKLFVTYSGNNVAYPPTKEQLDEAFGARNKRRGFIGALADSNGNPMYIVASEGDDWYYALMTKAV